MVESNSDIKMLDSFCKLYFKTSLEAKEILYNYASIKGNSISEILSLIFQIPRYSVITKYTVEQMIAQIDNQSTKSHTLNEAWIPLEQFNQPSARELVDLFNELCSCMHQLLILDLIKVISEYLSENVQRIFVGMQLYVFDTAGSWEIAEINQILWMSRQGEYFVYVKYDGWGDKWHEWICVNSPRLKWITTKQGQLVTLPALAIPVCVKAGKRYDFLSPTTMKWESVRVVKLHSSNISRNKYDIDIAYESGNMGTIRRTYGGSALAPHRTFT